MKYLLYISFFLIAINSYSQSGLGFWNFNNEGVDPFQDSIISWYGFNNNAIDSTGLNDATLQNSPSYGEDRFSYANRAIDLNGTTQYVTAPAISENNFSFAYLSIGVWFRPDATGTQQMVFYKGDNGEDAGDAWWRGKLGATNWDTRVGDTGGNAIQAFGTSTLVANAWYYGFFVWDNVNDTVYSYVDGILEDTGVNTSVGNIGSSSQLNIGRRQDSSQYFNGRIDDWVLYDSLLLTREQINKLYLDEVAQIDDLETWLRCIGNGDDRSDNANDATYVFTTGNVSDAYSGSGRAVDIGGSIGYIDCDASYSITGQDSHTIWIRLDIQEGQPAGTEYVYGVRSTDSGDEMYLALTSVGKLQFYYEANETSYTGLTDNVIYSSGANGFGTIGVVVDASQADPVIYIDGSSVAFSKTAGTDLSSITFSGYSQDRDLFFGAYNTGSAGSYIDCFFDDIKIYNAVLTSESITALEGEQK